MDWMDSQIWEAFLIDFSLKIVATLFFSPDYFLIFLSL